MAQYRSAWLSCPALHGSDGFRINGEQAFNHSGGSVARPAM